LKLNITHAFRNEYYLTDYIYKLGNFDANALDSLFTFEGYFDHFNANAQACKSSAFAAVRTIRTSMGITKTANDKIYEFVISPNFGFLGSPEPLMKDCELKLSFDRTKFKNALMEIATPTTPLKTENNNYLEILNPVAYTEYISSPALEHYFAKIDTSPIIYQYDECEVFIKNIPQNETTIRFDNLKGGNVPSYIFAAIIEQSALEGSLYYSSTGFKSNNVDEFNITLNGKIYLIL